MTNPYLADPFSDKIKECIPRGMMVRIIGTVSKVFRPYLSERFPTRGVITNVPSPMICINHKRISNAIYAQIRTPIVSNYHPCL